MNKQRVTHWVYSLGLSTGISVGVGCWSTADEHCGNLEGNRTCEERGIGAYCDTCRIADDGCTDVRPSDACLYPGVGSEPATGMDDSSTYDPAVTTAEGTTVSEPSVDSTAEPQPECMGNEECHDPAAPICRADGECVACNEVDDPDGACADLDAGLPVCDSGVCVQCTSDAPGECGEDLPVCDDALKTCVPCTEHEQCGPAACNLYTGACLPGDAVVHVGVGQQYQNLMSAISSLGEATDGTIVVQSEIYAETITVDGPRVLAFLASDAYPPIWDDGDSTTESQLSVSGGSTVFLDGLHLSRNGDDPAIRITGDQSRVWIDRSRVSNEGGGFSVESGAELVLRNTFVGGDSRVGANNSDVLLNVDNASVEIIYSTLINTGGYAVLSCPNPPVSIRVRNSIIATEHNVDEVSGCDGVVIVHTVSESDVGDLSQWFHLYRYGNFHLLAGGVPVFANVAQWQLGDPRVDIDGALRPIIDGSPDFAGADVP